MLFIHYSSAFNTVVPSILMKLDTGPFDLQTADCEDWKRNHHPQWPWIWEPHRDAILTHDCMAKYSKWYGNNNVAITYRIYESTINVWYINYNLTLNVTKVEELTVNFRINRLCLHRHHKVHMSFQAGQLSDCQTAQDLRVLQQASKII